MKLNRLLTENNGNSLLLRRIALTLQTELQENEHLGTIVDHIELERVESRSRFFDELITLHMTGPLFELSMDISYIGLPGLSNWTVEVRTDKDVPGDGLNLASANSSPEAWFTTDRLIKLLMKKKSYDTDMPRYNYLWFDKIARNLDKNYTFFLKNRIIDSAQIMTSQILKQDAETTVNRFGIEFCYTLHGYCYRLGLMGEAYRTVNNFSDINEILSGDEE